MVTDSKERFSSKVKDYILYRPHYPESMFDFLEENGLLKKGSVVADIGSGTGISCEEFLSRDCTVYGVEPNDAMRSAAEEIFKTRSRFISVKGTAENSRLPHGFIDLIFAAQAFHWFNAEEARNEFRRVLAPGGAVCLVWNDRKHGIPLLEDYEELLQKFGTDYNEVNHRNVDEKKFDVFFGKGKYSYAVFDNYQLFDKLGLRGRLLSSSYIPKAGTSAHEEMLVALDTIFDKHQQNGKVKFDYDTKLYYGHLD